MTCCSAVLSLSAVLNNTASDHTVVKNREFDSKTCESGFGLATNLNKFELVRCLEPRKNNISIKQVV